MTLLLLALLPATAALCLLIALVFSVALRSWRGERWEVALEGPARFQAATGLQITPWEMASSEVSSTPARQPSVA